MVARGILLSSLFLLGLLDHHLKGLLVALKLGLKLLDILILVVDSPL